MTLKTFFKSQTFKCILVLLAIALVSGGLLSIASDVLFVSEEERTTRAIKSIYGSEIAYETVFDLDKADSVPEYATGERLRRKGLYPRRRQLSYKSHGQKRLQKRNRLDMGGRYGDRYGYANENNGGVVRQTNAYEQV